MGHKYMYMSFFPMIVANFEAFLCVLLIKQTLTLMG